jgi:hypothetical protein
VHVQLPPITLGKEREGCLVAVSHRGQDRGFLGLGRRSTCHRATLLPGRGMARAPQRGRPEQLAVVARGLRAERSGGRLASLAAAAWAATITTLP